MGLLFEKQRVAMLQAIRRRKATDASSDDYDIVFRGSRRPRKYPAVAYLMADAVVLAIHAGGSGVRPCALCRDQREIDRAPGGYGSCPNELDEVPAIGAHFDPPSDVSSNSMPTSAPPSARTRRRYQTTIVISENTKMMVDTALISGVMPRRRRPQIYSG